MTGGFILVQAALEKALDGLAEGTCKAVSFDILLNSLWSSLGYFWNSAPKWQKIHCVSVSFRGSVGVYDGLFGFFDH